MSSQISLINFDPSASKVSVMKDFNKVFETGSIVLRPLIPEDAGEFKKVTGDKAMWIYFTHDLSDAGSLDQWVEEGVQENNNKTRLALSILCKQSNKLIGSTSIGNISERNRRVEIGWTWICRDYQGKGINDQAKYVLLDYCFRELQCERVEFKTDVLNIPARNALKRIGAVEEGILRSHTLMTYNRRRDTIYYSILSDEWKKIKAGIVDYEW
jgi:RimJ/RimL family protein N-acetyltransferase